MYAIVEFKNCELAIVPNQWIIDDGKRCYWPRSISNNGKFDIVVRNQEHYKSSWAKYRVVKVRDQSDNWDDINFKLNYHIQECEENNASSGCTIASVKRKIPVCADSSSDSDDDDSVVIKRRKILEDTNSINITPSLSLDVATPRSFLSVNSRKTADMESGSQDVQHKMLQLLIKLDERSKEQSLLINELIRTNRINASGTVEPPNLPTFPMTTIEIFLEFNSLLMEEEMKIYMISRLACLGGSNIETQTRRILKLLISDDVAMLYNWKGRDKLSFEKTKLLEIIYDAMKRSFPVSERSEFKVETSIKEWLKYAKSRKSKKVL